MNTNGLDPDRAISDEKDDLLGRHPLAYRIADMINNLGDDYKDSVVIGIEGEWGSGKSSFINLILNKVRPEKKKNLVIEFNPWNFSDQDELVKDFFTSMVNKLKSKNKGLIGNITKYVSKLRMPDKIVVAPSVGNNSAGSLEWNLNDKPLKKQKDEIDRDLKKLKKRIVIVIEDIDRLDSNETKLIFKLVRLIADFPNTVFMLAYDRNRVGERLTENNIDGEEYLKKIVQLPFLMPKPEQEGVYDELTRAVKKELVDRGFQGIEIDDRRFRELVSSKAFRTLFPTIRDIRRYTNSLRLDLKMLSPEELNPVDFVGVEAIRVFAPEVYLAMTDEKVIFTSDEDQEYSDRAQRSESYDRQKNIFEGMLAKAPGNLKNSIRDIIRQLFPQVEDLYSNGESINRRERLRRGDLRACFDEFFDKYFLLSVPSRLLSERKVREFLSKTNDPDAITNELREFQEDGKLSLLIERLPARARGLHTNRRENMLMCIFEFADAEERGSERLTRASVESGLKLLEWREERIQFVQNVIESKGVLFATTLLVQELNRTFNVEENDLYRLLSPLRLREEEGKIERLNSEIKELNGAYNRKINEAAKDASLISSKGLGYTLSCWKKLDEERAKSYISELLESKEGLFAFVEGASQYIRSEGGVGNLIRGSEFSERVKKLKLTSEENRRIRKNLPVRREYHWDKARFYG